MYQIIIKNGLVIDPANSIHKKADIAIADGKIAGVGKYGEDAVLIVDASNCIVTPGLIDHHAHLYPLAKIGIPAEAMCFSSGVTTAVDAGSTGCENFENCIDFITKSKLTIRAYINVCSTGLDSLPDHTEDVDPSHFNEGAIREVFQKYGDFLLGLKLRTSREVVGEMGYTPLKKTVEMAERLSLAVMVHCTNPPGKMSALLSYLRKGDVLTHMYMNKGTTILDADDRISQTTLDARKRGVIFEAADARAHFSFFVGERAIAQEFLPDIIATDLTTLSMNLRPTSFSMANQLSKYLTMGIDLDRLIACCTSFPASLMGLEGQVGCLSPGAWGDVAVFRSEYCDLPFGDQVYTSPDCHLRPGHMRLRPLLTVKKGEAVFRDIMF